VVDSSISLDIEELVDKHAPPEKILFLCVILQALLDATKPSTGIEPEEEKIARQSAKAWFFASIGVTAEDFIAVCDMADVDYIQMRSFAYKVLRSKEVEYTRRRINAVLSFK